MAERHFQLKEYWSTGVWPRGAQVRTRWGRSLNPLSSTNTTVRRCWRAFFYFRPAHPLPFPDGAFIALGRPADWPLATPTQGTQNPPYMPRMIFLTRLPLDQIGYPPNGP